MCRSSYSVEFFSKHVCFPELWMNLGGLDWEVNHSPWLALPSSLFLAPKILSRIKKEKTLGLKTKTPKKPKPPQNKQTKTTKNPITSQKKKFSFKVES